MIEFEKSFLDGQFPVRLAGRINHGLSYPYFNFNYPLVYYFALVVHLSGLSYVAVFKLILIVSTILGGLGIYFFSLKFFNKTSSLAAAIFYIYAPYRFLNMYVRGTVAEALALGMYPFLLYAIERLLEKKKGSMVLVSIVSALLIVSHNITAFFGIPLSILYFSMRLMQFKNKKLYIKNMGIAFIFSLLSTSFFWVPALFESGLTKLSELSEDYRLFFPTVREIIYSPWGFGPYLQGDVPGKMSPQIGIVHFGILSCAVLVLVYRLLQKKKKTEKDMIFLFFASVALICFFLLFPFSMFLWDHLFFLKLVQHPWRLVGYIVLSASISSAYLLSIIKNKKAAVFVLILFTGLLLYTNRNHVRVNMYVPFNNPFSSSLTYGPSTTSKDEHMPRFAPRIFKDPNFDGDIIASTSGVSQRTIWKSNYHLFKVKLNSDADFRDNTSYFPGWSATIDKGKTPMLYEQDEFYRLRVHVPKGEHVVEFRFGETWYRMLANLVSVGSVIVLGVLFVIKKK